MSRIGAIVAGLLMLVAVVSLQAARERLYPPPEHPDPDMVYLASGTAVRRLTSAYNALAADAYWVRAIQYFGATRMRLGSEQRGPEPPPLLASEPDEYPALYPLLDVTTSLDPRFNVAYRFGAVFLAEPYPGGPGRPDLAIKLLEKGLAERPDKWEYMQDIGFVHYWYRHDYQAAAEWFDKAANLPNAPWWLRSLAATTLAQGGDRASSRLMWQGIRDTAEVDWLKQDAERRLSQLRVMDEIDALQKDVDAYATRTGAPATDWTTLVRAGAFPGIPVDPTRRPYELDPNGRVRLSSRSPLWPLPDEPALLSAPPKS